MSKGTKHSMLEQTIVLVAGVWVGVGSRVRQEGQIGVNTFMGLSVPHLKNIEKCYLPSRAVTVTHSTNVYSS